MLLYRDLAGQAVVPRQLHRGGEHGLGATGKELHFLQAFLVQGAQPMTAQLGDVSLETPRPPLVAGKPAGESQIFQQRDAGGHMRRDAGRHPGRRAGAEREGQFRTDQDQRLPAAVGQGLREEQDRRHSQPASDQQRPGAPLRHPEPPACRTERADRFPRPARCQQPRPAPYDFVEDLRLAAALVRAQVGHGAGQRQLRVALDVGELPGRRPLRQCGGMEPQQILLCAAVPVLQYFRLRRADRGARAVAGAVARCLHGVAGGSRR